MGDPVVRALVNGRVIVVARARGVISCSREAAYTFQSTVAIPSECNFA